MEEVSDNLASRSGGLPSPNKRAQPTRLLVLSDDAVVTVTLIARETSLEGDRWVLATNGDNSDPITLLEVEVPRWTSLEGRLRSPPLAPGWRLETYTGHHDEGPDQIILRVK